MHFNKDAPATTIEVIFRPHTPWFSAKTGKKKCGKKMEQIKVTADREALKEKQRPFNDLC